MVKSNQRRVCEKVYNDSATSREHRKNIFKRDGDGNSIQTRYNKFNYEISHDNEKSDSICKKCYSDLVALEKADSIIVQLQVNSELGVTEKGTQEIDTETSQYSVRKNFLSSMYV